MSFLHRVQRHARLTAAARERSPQPTPPFLILFINSICNLACDHCFYWKELNQRTDLTRDEMFALSDSLGPIENLNLSGGEPFLRPEFAEICRRFVQGNGARKIYCPTNGYFADRTEKQLKLLFEDPDLEMFTAEISLDGMPQFHDKFRGNPRSFGKAMETYDMLAEFQRREPRLHIHSNSTCTGENVDEIMRLTTFLFERCPSMEHHNIAMLRGDRKRPTLMGPDLKAYRGLIDYIARLWRDRDRSRLGSSVEPMLHFSKERIAGSQSQAVPCKAGILTGVVYANGDVSVCEQREPLGNLRRDGTFPEIWNSEKAVAVRRSIARKECFCTNEVFLWPSIVFQPNELARAFVGSKAWKAPRPLAPGERVAVDVVRDGPAADDSGAARAIPADALKSKSAS